ncbi:MAG: diguanylate cyclase [Victivallales bacterium]
MDEFNEELARILDICIRIDAQAFSLYSKIEKSCTDDVFKSFWKSMAEEEKEHVLFWKKAHQLAEKNLLPNVFEDPSATLKKFEKLLARTCELIKKVKDLSNPSEILTIAYRLEFYMLNPEFATMFHIFKTLDGVENMEERYNQHVNEFIQGLMKYGETIPDAELLGDTLQSLWTDNKRLARENTLDLLTGILNRRGFFNAVNPMLHLAHRRDVKVSIMIADIDYFKRVNDTYGHHRGDEVLRYVASIIDSTIRKSDVAGRYGGEEFIIYADCRDVGSEQVVAEKIRKNVEAKTEAALGIKVTVSIGVASAFISGSTEKDIMALVRKADQNLYRAKAEGRNRVLC